jgi:hypothetical protein
MANATWEFARDILERHFRGVREPLFFGHALSTAEQTFVRGKPRPYILSAIDLLTKLGGRTIVEVGCMRRPLTHSLDAFDPDCCNDGHSTAFWASTGLAVHSVDVNPQCCTVAAQACHELANAHIYCSDGVEFLRAFQGTIDLLYLDAWDAVEGIPYAESHLEAYLAARQKLAPASLVLIDDTDIAFGGKGRLAVPQIIRDGFDLLLAGRQTMLLRLTKD